MTRQRTRAVARLTILISSSLLLPLGSCVVTAAKTVNNGIATAGSASVHGASQAFTAIGDGVSTVASWLTHLGG